MQALFLLQAQGGRKTRSGLLPDVGALPSDVDSYTFLCCGLGIGLQSYLKCQTALATLSWAKLYFKSAQAAGLLIETGGQVLVSHLGAPASAHTGRQLCRNSALTLPPLPAVSPTPVLLLQCKAFSSELLCCHVFP